MPASEVMKLYRQHKLHSGAGGPIVKSKKQATAIQISMARKEGHDIPEPKGSFQQGGLVPETGDYKVHQGEEVKKKPEVKVGEFGKQDTSSAPIGPISHPASGPGSTAGTKFYGQGDPNKPDPNWNYDPETEVWHPVLKHRTAAQYKEQQAQAPSYKHGGRIPRTGIYRLHRGEQVIPKSLVGAYRRAKHGTS